MLRFIKHYWILSLWVSSVVFFVLLGYLEPAYGVDRSGISATFFWLSIVLVMLEGGLLYWRHKMFGSLSRQRIYRAGDDDEFMSSDR